MNLRKMCIESNNSLRKKIIDLEKENFKDELEKLKQFKDTQLKTEDYSLLANVKTELVEEPDEQNEQSEAFFEYSDFFGGDDNNLSATLSEDSDGSYKVKRDRKPSKKKKVVKKATSSTENDSKKIQCKKCDEWLNGRLDVRYHMAEKHANELRFTCEYCEKKFYYKASYNRHLQTHGINVEKVEEEFCRKCLYCDEMFDKVKSHKEHIRKCHEVDGVTTFWCDVSDNLIELIFATNCIFPFLDLRQKLHEEIKIIDSLQRLSHKTSETGKR
jgi:RNase P subunit RPR2